MCFTFLFCHFFCEFWGSFYGYFDFTNVNVMLCLAAVLKCESYFILKQCTLLNIILKLYLKIHFWLLMSSLQNLKQKLEHSKVVTGSLLEKVCKLFY